MSGFATHSASSPTARTEAPAPRSTRVPDRVRRRADLCQPPAIADCPHAAGAARQRRRVGADGDGALAVRVRIQSQDRARAGAGDPDVAVEQADVGRAPGRERVDHGVRGGGDQRDGAVLAVGGPDAVAAGGERALAMPDGHRLADRVRGGVDPGDAAVRGRPPPRSRPRRQRPPREGRRAPPARGASAPRDRSPPRRRREWSRSWRRRRATRPRRRRRRRRGPRRRSTRHAGRGPCAAAAPACRRRPERSARVGHHRRARLVSLGRILGQRSRDHGVQRDRQLRCPVTHARRRTSPGARR